MQTNDTIIPDKQSAAGYDQQARETNWFGPDVVFGLAWEFVKPGDSLAGSGHRQWPELAPVLQGRPGDLWIRWIQRYPGRLPVQRLC